MEVFYYKHWSKKYKFKTFSIEIFLKSKGGKFLKKLWYCVSRRVDQVIQC